MGAKRLSTTDRRGSMRIIDEAAVGAANELFRHTVAFVDAQSGDVGCGTLVSVGTHLLVATAGHLVPLRPESRLRFVSMHPRRMSDPVTRVLSAGRARASEPDVGFLELDPAEAPGALGKSPIGIERIRDHATGREGYASLMVGCPVEAMERGRTRDGNSVTRFNMNSVTMTAIPPRHWRHRGRADAVAPSLRRDRDVLFEYTRETFNLNTRTMRTAERPHGFSGGGIWDLHIDGAGPWSPGRISLFAIQSAFLRKRSQLRAIQIKHWLKLVAERYPDIAAEVQTVIGVGKS